MGGAIGGSLALAVGIALGCGPLLPDHPLTPGPTALPGDCTPRAAPELPLSFRCRWLGRLTEKDGPLPALARGQLDGHANP
jgi:hypothetical protein